MDTVLSRFAEALSSENGYALKDTLSPIAPPSDPVRLHAIQNSANSYSILAVVRSTISGVPLDQQTATLWTDVYVAYWKAINELLLSQQAHGRTRTADSSSVYAAWQDLTNAVYKGHYQKAFPAWTIPGLYATCRHLRTFAIRADVDAQGKRPNLTVSIQDDDIADDDTSHQKQEDAVRVISKVFSVCLNDRSSLHESRKWGIYYIAVLLFKSYFSLNSINLAKNNLKSIAASTSDTPPLEACPKSHQVAYNYYLGVISFLDENYPAAEEYLNHAYKLCHRDSKKNIQLILTYLVPTRLLTSQALPTTALLAAHPMLQKLFGPLATCIRSGNLAGFDAAMEAGEDEFVRRRIFLTLERGRDICLRNLIRKVYLAGGYEVPKEGQADEKVRRSRLPIAEITTALRAAGEKDIENDEVECFIANLIYKNLMKGYISRAHGILVLNKKGDAFPGTTKS